MTDILENLAELNPEALLADGLGDALIGYTLNTLCAYVGENTPLYVWMPE